MADKNGRRHLRGKKASGLNRANTTNQERRNAQIEEAANPDPFETTNVQY